MNRVASRGAPALLCLMTQDLHQASSWELFIKHSNF